MTKQPAYRGCSTVGELLEALNDDRNLSQQIGEWGLEVSVLSKSWYNLGNTVHVVLYPPERYR